MNKYHGRNKTDALSNPYCTCEEEMKRKIHYVKLFDAS